VLVEAENALVQLTILHYLVVQLFLPSESVVDQRKDFCLIRASKFVERRKEEEGKVVKYSIVTNLSVFRRNMLAV